MFVVQDGKFDFQQSGDLLGLYRGVDQWSHSAAYEVDQMMVVLQFWIFSEDRAFFRLRNMRFECEHTIAAGEAEQIVHALKRLLMGDFVVRRALDRGDQAFHQINESLLRRPNDKPAECRTADCHELGGVYKRAEMSAGHREPAEYGADDDNNTDDNN